MVAEYANVLRLTMAAVGSEFDERFFAICKKLIGINFYLVVLSARDRQ